MGCGALTTFDAKIALKGIEALLCPPRNTGQGYKLCKLDTVTRNCYKAIASCLCFYLQAGLNLIDASRNASIGAGHGEWYAQTI